MRNTAKIEEKPWEYKEKKRIKPFIPPREGGGFPEPFQPH
jgi:hypothetical protein